MEMMADLDELVDSLRAGALRSCAHGTACVSHSADLDGLQALANTAAVGVHVAVMVEPYLSFVVKGQKWIESRLTKNRIAPFGQAVAGDIVLFKRSGGPITAVAIIDDVLTRETSSSADVYSLASEYSEGLSYETGYAESKHDAKYVTLLWLRDVRALSDPLPLAKRGRQAWLTFQPDSRRRHDAHFTDQQALF